MIRLDIRKQERIDSSKLSAWQRFKLFVRLQQFVLPLWDKLLLRILCTQAAGMLVLVPPILMVTLVDDVFPQKDIPALFQHVGMALAALFVSHLLLFIGGIPTNFQTAWIVPESILGNYMIARVMLDVKMRFLRKLQKLSVSFFQSRPIGDHMFRGSLDLDDASLLASESIPLIMSTVQRIAMTSYLLFQIGPDLFFYVMLYLAFFFTAKHLLVSIFRYMDRQFRLETGGLEAVTREVLASSKVIKGYDRQRTTRRWYGDQTGRVLRRFFWKENFMFFDMHLTGNAFNILLPLFCMYFGSRVLAEEITLGQYLSATTLLWLLITPLQEIISLFQLIRQRLIPVERMIETFDVEPDITDAPDAVEVDHFEGAIEFRDVDFAYDPAEPVLRGVSLKVEPGEKVALVGPIGAGKTTLTNLLLRLYEPQSGQVLVDGRDIREYSQHSLRKHVGVVMQQINTFTESIAHNIYYGDPLASRRAMLEAARLACVEEFVLPLPGQYETVLSEGGSLSGGQKQRICLSRALIRDPRILIMDEATSALDPVTEKTVIENIDAQFAGRSRLIVAHNLLSAKTADRIYVLDEGRIVESGRHEDLMRQGGAYRRLWTSEQEDAT